MATIVIDPTYTISASSSTASNLAAPTTTAGATTIHQHGGLAYVTSTSATTTNYGYSLWTDDMGGGSLAPIDAANEATIKMQRDIYDYYNERDMVYKFMYEPEWGRMHEDGAVRFNYHAFTGWTDLEAIIDEKNEMLRFAFYKNRGWKDEEAKADASVKINLAYHRHNEWKDLDWYKETNHTMLITGLSECLEFEDCDALRDMVDFVLTKVITENRGLSTTMLSVLYQIMEKMDKAFIKVLLFKNYGEASEEIRTILACIVEDAASPFKDSDRLMLGQIGLQKWLKLKEHADKYAKVYAPYIPVQTWTKSQLTYCGTTAGAQQITNSTTVRKPDAFATLDIAKSWLKGNN